MGLSSGLTVCMIAHNEEFWLRYTLPLAVKNADAVIFVDGSPNGPSTDRTPEIAKAFLVPERDKYISGVFGEEGTANNWDKVQRNVYLDHIRTSHLLVLDADEAYMDWGWDMLYGFVSSDIDFATYPITHFWKNDKNIINVGAFASWAHRFQRYIPGMNYKDISTVLYLDNGMQYNKVAENQWRGRGLQQFHYGHASPASVYKAKQAKFKKRDDGGNLSDDEYKDWLAKWTDNRDMSLAVKFNGNHPLSEYSQEIWGE